MQNRELDLKHSYIIYALHFSYILILVEGKLHGKQLLIGKIIAD